MEVAPTDVNVWRRRCGTAYSCDGSVRASRNGQPVLTPAVKLIACVAAGLVVASVETTTVASETYVQLTRPTFSTVVGYGSPTSERGNYHGLGIGGAFGLTFAFTHDSRSAGLWLGANLVFHNGTTSDTTITGTTDTVTIRNGLSATYWAAALGVEWFIGSVLVRPSLQIGYQHQSKNCLRGEGCRSTSGTLGFAAIGSLIAIDIPLRDVESPRALRVGFDVRSMHSTSAMWGSPAPSLDTSALALYFVGEAAL